MHAFGPGHETVGSACRAAGREAEPARLTAMKRTKLTAPTSTASKPAGAAPALLRIAQARQDKNAPNMAQMAPAAQPRFRLKPGMKQASESRADAILGETASPSAGCCKDDPLDAAI